MVCLLIGVLWGMMTVRQMEKEQATKTTADNSQEQENQTFDRLLEMAEKFAAKYD